MAFAKFESLPLVFVGISVECLLSYANLSGLVPISFPGEGRILFF